MQENQLAQIENPEDLGETIKTWRKTFRITQEELAEMAGVGRRFIIELEHGKESIQIGKALKVLASLKLGLECFPVKTGRSRD